MISSTIRRCGAEKNQRWLPLSVLFSGSKQGQVFCCSSCECFVPFKYAMALPSGSSGDTVSHRNGLSLVKIHEILEITRGFAAL